MLKRSRVLEAWNGYELKRFHQRQPEQSDRSGIALSMESTERKATSGMTSFVIAIFIVGVIIAVGYLFLLSPGEVAPTTITPS